MSDRELLELAAKVAGVRYVPEMSRPHPSSGAWWGLWIKYDREPHEFDRRYWNPLTDDGDALRLAVKLRLKVEVLNYGCSARQKASDNWQACPAHLNGGIESATRRAIVRAAAEIATPTAAQAATDKTED